MAKYVGKQVRCIRSRRHPGTDVDARPGGWITKIVCRLLCVDMGNSHARMVPKRSSITGKSLIGEGCSSSKDPRKMKRCWVLTRGGTTTRYVMTRCLIPKQNKEGTTCLKSVLDPRTRRTCRILRVLPRSSRATPAWFGCLEALPYMSRL